MKYTFIAAMFAACALTLAACGEKKHEEATTTTETTTTETTTAPTEHPAEAPAAPEAAHEAAPAPTEEKK